MEPKTDPAFKFFATTKVEELNVQHDWVEEATAKFEVYEKKIKDSNSGANTSQR